MLYVVTNLIQFTQHDSPGNMLLCIALCYVEKLQSYFFKSTLKLYFNLRYHGVKIEIILKENC